MLTRVQTGRQVRTFPTVTLNVRDIGREEEEANHRIQKQI